MTYTTTTTPAETAAKNISMFDVVTSALEAKGRLPCARPQLGLPGNIECYDVSGLYLEQHPGGWVANIALQDVPEGKLNTIGTPDASPYPTKREAFLAGAAILCRLLTGSQELPFIASDNELRVFGYGTGGVKGIFSMSQPAPWL